MGANKADLLIAAAARSAADFATHHLADLYFQKAIEQGEAKPETFLFDWRELYERRHRVPEVANLIDRALAINPAHAPAMLIRARLERQSGSAEKAESLLQSLIKTGDREIRS